MTEKCLSYNVRVSNDKGSVSFMCPNCGKHKIIRSSAARISAAKYTCPACGFTGPN